MPLIDRAKFDASSTDILVWKYPSESLSTGTQLVVHESQEALVVKGGAVIGTFGPGTHTLSTGNLPLLRSLVNLPFGGKTPFTAEVWYVTRTAKRGLKWGTRAPIPLIDPMYNVPVSVRAFGDWGMRIADSRSFVVQLVGSRGLASSDMVEKYFAGEIVQRLSNQVATFFVDERVSIFEANARLNDLSARVARDIEREFSRFGIEVTNFNVERLSIPAEERQSLQDVLGKRMELEQLSGIQTSEAYRTVKSFEILGSAAENQSGAGTLAEGLALGAGIGAAAPIAGMLGAAVNPPANANSDPAERLRKLKDLLDGGLITEEEYTDRKTMILDAL